jgi:hypothetical protein
MQEVLMKRVFLVIPLILVSVGFFSCSMDGNNNLFVETWVSTAEDGEYPRIIMKSDLTWEFHQSASGDTMGDTRGTYTYTGNNATAIALEIYMGAWMETAELPEAAIPEGLTLEDMITSSAEIQSDGILTLTTFEGSFTYTREQ